MGEISERADELISRFGIKSQFYGGDPSEPHYREDSHKARQALIDYIAELEAAQRWIPVSEGLPKPYEWVLINLPMFNAGVAFYSPDGYWMFEFDDEHISPEKVTLWRPIPKPPEVEQ